MLTERDVLRLETYIRDAERDGDSELADFFRRAQSDSRRGADEGKTNAGQPAGELTLPRPSTSTLGTPRRHSTGEDQEGWLPCTGPEPRRCALGRSRCVRSASWTPAGAECGWGRRPPARTSSGPGRR